MRAFRAVVVAGTAVAYALAMLGSWTRINGAGMACPDWPLCHGAVVPVLLGGVVLEWLHRLLAFLETFLVAGVIVTGMRLRSAIPALSGMLLALAAVFVLQVLLGGATIVLANSPLSVMVHWGAAMLLLAVLSSLTVVAFVYDPRRSPPAFGRRRGAVPLLLASGCAFAAMCAGAYVSSSGAGLACRSIPACGSSLFGRTGLEAIQMTHRLLVAVLVVGAVAASVVLPRSRRPAIAALRIALVLLGVQIVLGALNVLWSLPTALREAHAATAIATFLGFVVATVFASLEPRTTTDRARPTLRSARRRSSGQGAARAKLPRR